MRKIDVLDHSMPPVDASVSGETKQCSYVFEGVCEDSYIKNITLFTAVPCPSCSTLTSPISRVTGAIIVAVTGLIAGRAICASFTCYIKTNIINKTMFCFVYLHNTKYCNTSWNTMPPGFHIKGKSGRGLAGIHWHKFKASVLLLYLSFTLHEKERECFEHASCYHSLSWDVDCSKTTHWCCRRSRPNRRDTGSLQSRGDNAHRSSTGTSAGTRNRESPQDMLLKIHTFKQVK